MPNHKGGSQWLNRRGYLSLAGSAGIAGLAGCLGDDDDTNDNGAGMALEWWNIWTGGAIHDVSEEIATAFTEDTGIEVEFGRFGLGDYRPQLRNALGTDVAPDTFFTWPGPDRMGREVAADQVISLEDRFDSSILDNISEPAKQRVRFEPDDQLSWGSEDGEIFGIPLTTPTIQWWYNRDVIDDAGIEEGRIHHAGDVGWDEFTDICEQIKEAGYTPIQIGNTAQWPAQLPFTDIMAKAGGGDLLKEIAFGEADAAFTDDNFVEAVSSFQELHEEEYINRDINALSNDDAISIFYDDGAAFFPMGSWVNSMIEGVKEEDEPGIPEKIDYMWAPFFPDLYDEGAEERFLMADYVHPVSQAAVDRGHEDSTIELVEYMCSEGLMEKFLEDGDQPISRPDLWDNVDQTPVHETVGESLNQAVEADNTYDPLDLTLLPAPVEVMYAGIQELFDGTPAEEMLQNLQDSVDESLEEV